VFSENRCKNNQILFSVLDSTKLVFNVSRLQEVAIYQDQAFANINKTFIIRPFQFLTNPVPRHFLKPLLADAFFTLLDIP
jgi:hypothetical protein